MFGTCLGRNSVGLWSGTEKNMDKLIWEGLTEISDGKKEFSNGWWFNAIQTSTLLRNCWLEVTAPGVGICLVCSGRLGGQQGLWWGHPAS